VAAALLAEWVIWRPKRRTRVKVSSQAVSQRPLAWLALPLLILHHLLPVCLQIRCRCGSSFSGSAVVDGARALLISGCYKSNTSEL
jgi:hypothetical protein